MLCRLFPGDCERGRCRRRRSLHCRGDNKRGRNSHLCGPRRELRGVPSIVIVVIITVIATALFTCCLSFAERNLRSRNGWRLHGKLKADLGRKRRQLWRLLLLTVATIAIATIVAKQKKVARRCGGLWRESGRNVLGLVFLWRCCCYNRLFCHGRHGRHGGHGGFAHGRHHYFRSGSGSGGLCIVLSKDGVETEPLCLGDYAGQRSTGVPAGDDVEAHDKLHLRKLGLLVGAVALGKYVDLLQVRVPALLHPQPLHVAPTDLPGLVGLAPAEHPSVLCKLIRCDAHVPLAVFHRDFCFHLCRHPNSCKPRESNARLALWGHGYLFLLRLHRRGSKEVCWCSCSINGCGWKRRLWLRLCRDWWRRCIGLSRLHGRELRGLAEEIIAGCFCGSACLDLC